MRRRVYGSGSALQLPIGAAMSEKLLRLRYPATCSSCGGALAKGTEAIWNREAKTVTCAICYGAPEVSTAAAAEIERGEAGGSAAREWRRRHDRREQAIRSRYGKLSGVVLALSEDPRSTAAWACGADGERALGKLLDPLRDEGLAVLHDRRIPRSKANIDHLVVAPCGVFVVDAKNYQGRVETRDRGRFFATDYWLYVGGCDKRRSSLA